MSEYLGLICYLAFGVVVTLLCWHVHQPRGWQEYMSIFPITFLWPLLFLALLISAGRE